MKIVGIIPSRYASTRFPGKPLALIAGRPMVWHVYQQAIQARTLDEVIVATDDVRIMDACREFSVPVLLTRGDHFTGTDRLTECARLVDADYYVNVQGDEPMIAPEAIDLVADAIVRSADARVLVSNGFKRIHDEESLASVGAVKVAVDADGLALDYSRRPIPGSATRPGEFYRQLGLYAFSRAGLARFATLQPGPRERAESIELLRFLEHGHAIAMVQVPDDDALSVDTPDDLVRVEALMAERGLRPPQV